MTSHSKWSKKRIAGERNWNIFLLLAIRSHLWRIGSPYGRYMALDTRKALAEVEKLIKLNEKSYDKELKK